MNRSKMNDPRFWRLWERSGAVRVRNRKASQHRAEAQKWLDFLRQGAVHGTYDYNAFVGYLRKEVEKGSLSLADIGTSETELRSFIK